MADNDLDDSPNDSIASALASAIAEHEAPKEAVAAEPAEKPVAVPPEKGSKSDAPKDAPKEQRAETETPEPQEGDSEAPEPKPDQEKQASASGSEPPANWPAADKETFKKLAPEGQQFLLKRHREMEAAFTKKTQEIAEFRREFDPVNKIFEPYRDRMKAGGWTPAKLVEAWSNVEKRLMEGDGVNVVAGLVQGYKVDLGKVAQALGIRPRAAATDPGTGAAQPEPTAHDALNLSPDHPVIRQLASIQERLAADDRARMDLVRRNQTAAEQRVMSEIEEFKSALDDKGTALHPHFDELEDVMTQLAQSAIAAKKPVPPLKELYETAVWANPSTRAALQSRERRDQEAKVADEARAKAERARRAGSSVTGAPGSGQARATPIDRTLREELEEAAADAAG